MRQKFLKLKKSLAVTRSFLIQYKKWRAAAKSITHLSGNESKSLVVIPCDPWTIGGSRGDEAMLTAVIQNFRAKYAGASVSIVSGSDDGNRYVSNLEIDKVTYLYEWRGSYPMVNIYKAVVKTEPSDVVILGADCMDGYYSPLLSLTLLGLHDLFSNTPGICSRLMGFSFNSHPYPFIPFAFNHIAKGTVINLRDVISKSRIESMTRIKAGLVADVAFLLKPDYGFSGYAKLSSWIGGLKVRGIKTVIGINFHPMLKKYSRAEDTRQDALTIGQSIVCVMSDNPALATVLIPHDDRNLYTDNIMLSVIYDTLCKNGMRERVYYDSTVYRASQLKATCGLIDGLVSSRMHLAIAALGQGKSVLAVSYQGKFEGLYAHFGLPIDFLVTPDLALSDMFVQIFKDYLEHLSALTKQVHVTLPSVMALASRNLS